MSFFSLLSCIFADNFSDKNKCTYLNLVVIISWQTCGFLWQFLKLEGQTLFIDSQRYAIANLPQRLGAIQKVYNFYK